MNYLNIEIALLRSPEFSGAEPHHQAVWLKLLAYCADQETGGMIRDARKWKPFQWQYIGIDPAFLEEECPLWRIEVGHLRVWGYPIKQQQEMQKKRKGGKLGNSRRWNDKVLEMPVKYRPGSE